VFLNAILGYVQQERAESAIAALRQMSAAHAHVVRDGEPTSVPATDVARGHPDREDGDTVPADGRLVHSIALHACSRESTARRDAGLLPFLSAV
jgi:Ca2+-transporting ATPase